jgi:hypothetical protein
MRIWMMVAALMLAAVPAAAEDFPRSPKAGPPEPLPEAACDTAKPDAGAWLQGRWVAPMSRWEFTGREFRLEQKAEHAGTSGYKDGTVIAGRVEAVSACSLRLAAGEANNFTFEGVLTEGGKIYGFAANPAGQRVRYVLRRER